MEINAKSHSTPHNMTRGDVDLADVARAAVPTPELIRALVRDEADAEARSTFTESALTALQTLRERCLELEPPSVISNNPSSSRPRALVEPVEDAPVRVSELSSTALALAACASHGRTSSRDVPGWSSEALADAADATFEACVGAAHASMAFRELATREFMDTLRAPGAEGGFGADAEVADARAVVASRQMRWCVDASTQAMDVSDVLDVALTCVLRAMDYPHSEVRANGARAASVIARRRGEEGFPAEVLLDASRSLLVGAVEDVWPHALETACMLTPIVENDEDFRKTFDKALDTACLRGLDVAYARPLLDIFSDFTRSAGVRVVAHLSRLLPLLCSYLHAVKDDIAIDAAKLIAIVIENSWPRMHAHCASMWPHAKRAYAEADGRSAKRCDELRLVIRGIVELLQLAAGKEFMRVWSADLDVPEHARELVAFLESLPKEREFKTSIVVA